MQIVALAGSSGVIFRDPVILAAALSDGPPPYVVGRLIVLPTAAVHFIVTFVSRLRTVSCGSEGRIA